MGIAILRFFTAFFIIATIIPLIKLDFWWIRVFDYPRLQKLVIIFILIGIWTLIYSKIAPMERWIWFVSLFASAIFLFTKVLPFSILGPKMIDTVESKPDAQIHLVIANVYQPNTEYSKVLNLVRSTEPDLVFLVETDQKWLEGTSELDKSYPYSVKLPLDNTYGMLLFSKLEILKQEINYLIDEEIPSLEFQVKLRNGQKITIYAIHPTPPVPGENPKSTERDAEILLIAEKVKNNPNPSLVIGDLNDVAWSYTTELFLKVSEMADPRRGRGTFNTFHAKVPFLRWPLDHVFLSKHFGLIDIKVEEEIGSDHFPISLTAILTPDDTTDVMEANGEEKEEAHEKIDRGLNENDKN